MGECGMVAVVETRIGVFMSNSKGFNDQAIERDEYGNPWAQELSAGQLERTKRVIEALTANNQLSADDMAGVVKWDIVPRVLVARIHLALTLAEAIKNGKALGSQSLANPIVTEDLAL